jgi:hypothetical protein
MRPDFPAAALQDVLNWLKAGKAPGAVIGGIAVSLLGEPRYTEDIDLVVVIDEPKQRKLVELAPKFNLAGRVPDVFDFARDTRMLLMQHTPSGTSIDISLGMLDFEKEMIKRAKIIKHLDLKIPVANSEDLIILKIIAQRPQDLADVANILDNQDEIDLARVRQTVDEFSAALDRPDMMDDLERLLARTSRRRKR